MRNIIAETPDGTLIICPADYDPTQITEEDIIHDGAIVRFAPIEGDEIGAGEYARTAIYAPAAAGRTLEWVGVRNGHAAFQISGLSDTVFEPIHRHQPKVRMGMVYPA